MYNDFLMIFFVKIVACFVNLDLDPSTQCIRIQYGSGSKALALIKGRLVLNQLQIFPTTVWSDLVWRLLHVPGAAQQAGDVDQAVHVAAKQDHVPLAHQRQHLLTNQINH